MTILFLTVYTILAAAFTALWFVLDEQSPKESLWVRVFDAMTVGMFWPFFFVLVGVALGFGWWRKIIDRQAERRHE